jgi:hypothetical protein
MYSYAEPLAVSGDLAVDTCGACGRHPAGSVTVRRHVGLIYFHRTYTVQAVACRACGRRLVRNFTLRTLVQGWWGAISFFFTWFVLGANALAWLRLRNLAEPSISGTDGLAATPGLGVWDLAPSEKTGKKRKTSRLGKSLGFLFVGFILLGLVGWGWDATHHDHGGPHGEPITAMQVENEMTGQMYVTDAGGRVWVESAACTGAAGDALRQTHFRCQLVFDNAAAEEVLVHVERHELFFKSSLAGGA